MRRATIFLVASLAVFLMAPAVAAAGTLDQQQTAFDPGFATVPAPGGNGAVAQTFTAGITGSLDRVDLLLASANPPATYLSVEIRDAPGGVPGQAILASRPIPPSAVTSTTPQFIPVDFRPPAPVVAGTQYAIVAYSANVATTWFLWYFKNSDVYSGGQFFYNGTTPPTSSWTAAPSQDLSFKTYVVPTPFTPAPSPTPSAGPTGKRAAALAKCKHKHGKKRKRCKQQANRLPV